MNLLTGESVVHVICMYGMGGVGKTALLRRTYNVFKVNKGGFDFVIWVKVGQFPNLADLQSCIVHEIKHDLPSYNDVDYRKTSLSASLRDKKVLVFLDDLRRFFDINQLGMAFFNNQGSKIVFSARQAGEMGAQESMKVQTLLLDEATDSFCKIAFEGQGIPQDKANTWRQVADECKGFPLAVRVLAATLRRIPVDDWKLALKQMQTADPNFLSLYPHVNDELFEPLRWSYDHLPNPTSQNCFLYRAIFPKDAEIHLQLLNFSL